MKNVVTRKSSRKQNLFTRVVALIEEARRKVATVANVAQVYTNYEIGRQIVEEEQGGKRRAGYGEQVLIDLSSQLTSRFGRGFSVDNLQNMRTFYLVYSTIEISETPSRKSSIAKCETPSRKFSLSWSHYVLLMRIADPVERAFYEREAAERNWSFRQLERMYRTSTFERLQISKDKDKVRKLMTKLKKVGHDELGQMQTYINYFDRKVKLPDENPTIGILLTSEKVDQALVEMFTPDSEKNRIFVKQYTSVMPSKAALKRIVIEEKRKFEKEKLLALARRKGGGA